MLVYDNAKCTWAHIDKGNFDDVADGNEDYFAICKIRVFNNRTAEGWPQGVLREDGAGSQTRPSQAELPRGALLRSLLRLGLKLQMSMRTTAHQTHNNQGLRNA